MLIQAHYNMERTYGSIQKVDMPHIISKTQWLMTIKRMLIQAHHKVSVWRTANTMLYQSIQIKQGISTIYKIHNSFEHNRTTANKIYYSSNKFGL